VDSSGEIIIKVVNVQDKEEPMEISLQGVQDVDRAGTAWVLTGELADVNTVANPKKVAPKEVAINTAAPTFGHRFPAHSITVIRLKAR
jgi:alpha-L-arabinofuranosidase